MDHIDELAHALARFPGIGPRQGKRFVYYLLSATREEREKLSKLIDALGKSVIQCPLCMRFHNGSASAQCTYCTNKHRDDALLMVVEKDQDLMAVERAGTYKGRYFVLGGALTLSGKGVIREKELLLRTQSLRASSALKEVVLALSATSEGEHTADRVRALLQSFRDDIRISTLGRGLATGSELEYSDAETLRAALAGRKET